MAAYRGYLRDLVAGKADGRADDYASALLAIHDEDPEALSHEEIASILFSLSFAGHETTNYLIGNLVRRLLEERARWEPVVAEPRADPRRGGRDPALRHLGARVAARDHAARHARRGGPAGGREALPLARRRPAATRRFPGARPFDPRRENARHSSPSARASTTARARASASSRRSSRSRA